MDQLQMSMLFGGVIGMALGAFASVKATENAGLMLLLICILAPMLGVVGVVLGWLFGCIGIVCRP